MKSTGRADAREQPLGEQLGRIAFADSKGKEKLIAVAFEMNVPGASMEQYDTRSPGDCVVGASFD
jgi:hypothetical protein